jgi:hypothetical protein
MQLGMPGVGLGDGLGAEIDAEAVGRLQRGQQIAAAAAQFQHPLAGRDQKPHELLIVFVVSGVELAPAIQIVAVGLLMVEQIPLALAGKPRRSSRIGLLQVHSRPRDQDALLTEGPWGVNSTTAARIGPFRSEAPRHFRV